MHKKYLFTNILGSFVVNEHCRIIGQGKEAELKNKYKNLVEPSEKEIKKILDVFKGPKYFKDFREKNIQLTKKTVKESVTDDILIIQTVNNLSDIDKTKNILTKRLREWFSYNNPELEHSVNDQERFVELVLENKALKKDSMGRELAKEHIEPINNLAKQVQSLHKLKLSQEAYLEKVMKKITPNLLAIAGAKIGAQLLEQAGSLKSLMEFPASTIQILGAEKALFRHMKTGAKAPKFGFLHEHPLLTKSPREIQGKVARTLADKISMAVKIDYFKGEFIGDKLLKQVEAKFK